MDRFADLVVAFEVAHGRQPTALELVSIRSAAKLAAAAESPRTSAEQVVRASNTLHRVLSRLGLARPPGKAKPARPAFPSVADILARR